MPTITDLEFHAELLDWARGDNTLVAATQLLININRLRPISPWVRSDNGRHWIDFDSIPESIGALSSGEQSVLRIAASIGGTSEVNLSDDVARLDAPTFRHVLNALVHAAGFTSDIS